MSDTNKNEIEEIIGYSFKSQELRDRALTHSSYTNENRMKNTDNNERLEFLGDAVLELTVSDFIYQQYPDLSEGEMTKLRAGIVCEGSLAKIARQLQIGSFIKMGKGEEQTGGRNRDSILSDAVEAIIGALYLDGGFAMSRQFVLEQLRDEIKTVRENIMQNDCKTFLQEYIQRTSKEPLEYNVTAQKGPDHDKTFVVELLHKNRVIGTGEGKSKKEAEQNAAQSAIKLLKAAL